MKNYEKYELHINQEILWKYESPREEEIAQIQNSLDNVCEYSDSMINKSRTKLLLIANEELNKLKKNCLTKINDKSLATAEKEFSSQNNQIINLKSEFFLPYAHIGQAGVKKQSNKFLYVSPDDSTRLFRSDEGSVNSVETEKRELSFNTNVSEKDINFSPFPKIVEKKKSIFKKKDEHFKNVILKIFKEEDEFKIEKDSDHNLCFSFAEDKTTNLHGTRCKDRSQNFEIGLQHYVREKSRSKSKNTRLKNKEDNSGNYFHRSKNLINLMNNLNLSEKAINKKKKKMKAVEGFNYLHDLCRKIKLKNRKKTFCNLNSSGEKEKKNFSDADFRKNEINRNYDINYNSASNVIENKNQKIIKNIDKRIIPKPKCNVPKNVPIGKDNLVQSYPKKQNPKYNEINYQIKKYLFNSQDSNKEDNIPIKKQKLSGGLLKINSNEVLGNINKEFFANVNLNNSYAYPKKEEFYIQLYKC